MANRIILLAKSSDSNETYETTCYKFNHYGKLLVTGNGYCIYTEIANRQGGDTKQDSNYCALF